MKTYGKVLSQERLEKDQNEIIVSGENRFH